MMRIAACRDVAPRGFIDDVSRRIPMTNVERVRHRVLALVDGTLDGGRG